MRYVFGFLFLIISITPGAEAQSRIGVEGHVFNSSGRPLSNASISVRGFFEGGGRFEQFATSDTNGFYQVDFTPTQGEAWASFQVAVSCKNAKRRVVQGQLPLYNPLQEGQVYRRDFYLNGDFENGRCK